MTTVVCVKVSNIRPKYNNLKEWMKDPDNVYIGRRGIVFVDGERWPKQDSKFANPFKITKDVSRQDVIKSYCKWLMEQIENGDITMDDLKQLQGKRLGCWCKEKGNEPCHGDILKEIIDELD